MLENCLKVDEIFTSKHPYITLPMPTAETKEDRLDAIPGTPLNLIETLENPLKGDMFAPRNKYAMKIDLEEEPPFFKVSDTHYAKTWLLHPKAPTVKPPIAVQRIMKSRKEDEKNEKKS